jgi:uncharacterized protein (DUF2147 family)
MKKALLSLCCLCCSVLFAGDIGGFWKNFDEDSGKPDSVIAVYEYQGKYYGRIIGTYDEEGKMTDTIYAPKEKATKMKGSPFYCGLDIIWDLETDDGSRYSGKILDPEKGSVYDAELWIKGVNLMVRGEVLFFSEEQSWVPAVDSDFPKGFKKPDVSKFIPSIPETD